MGKTIGLKQLAQKTYVRVEGINEDLAKCIGIVEDAFDCIIYGRSGNGKSNFTAMFLKELLKALGSKCEYIAYEEGHAATIQETLINRHNMLEELGNVLLLTDYYTFEELQIKMRKKQSAKIWVIDSVQSARFTEEQCADLKREFVLSRKKKIIIYVSWADPGGKEPKGAAAKSIEYNAHLKLRVEGLMVFPKTRFEKNGIGGKTYVIYEPGARAYWGEEYDRVLNGHSKKVKPKKKTSKPKKEKKTEENSNGESQTPVVELLASVNSN